MGAGWGGEWAVASGLSRGPKVDWSGAVQGTGWEVMGAPQKAVARVAEAGRMAPQAHVSLWKRRVRWSLAR